MRDEGNNLCNLTCQKKDYFSIIYGKEGGYAWIKYL